MKLTFKEKMEHLIQSGFQTVYVPTVERARCEDELLAVAVNLDMEIVVWDGINGFSMAGKEAIVDPASALISIEDDKIWKKMNAILVFRNLHVWLEDPIIRQAFQNMYYARKFSNDSYKRPAVILSGVLQVHPEVAPCVTVVNFSLPDEQQLRNVFNDVVSSIDAGNGNSACSTEMSNKIVQSLRGLTSTEAENTLAYSLRVSGGFTEDLIQNIEDQKAAALEKSEVLRYVSKEKIATMDEVGGFGALKGYIAQRKVAYTEEARANKIDLPRGIVLLGQPGSGKSLISRVIAKELELPLIIFKFANIFGSLVGESERRMRSALEVIDAFDGAVVLIDEADKALGGANDAMGDSGVTRRAFGELLTWLNDKTSRTYMIITMNRTRGIPPEFLRKGRFDEIFYADLPDELERDEIFTIHLKRRGVDVNALKRDRHWQELLNATDGFVGSEIEQIVIDARFVSFSTRKTGQPTVDELMASRDEITPLSVSDRENIEDIRRMCEGRARPVSKLRTLKTKTRQRALRLTKSDTAPAV